MQEGNIEDKLRGLVVDIPKDKENQGGVNLDKLGSALRHFKFGFELSKSIHRNGR